MSNGHLYLAAEDSGVMRILSETYYVSEKPGNEPEEVTLQNASKQIVQNAIRQAVQQVSQEGRLTEERTRANEGTCQLRVGELTKKHEKK
ncbi:A-kinase anchor protein inhibitor 1 [Tenrec ecaudatus]|uniref:A-kinase anchor protein inhibitor 1 n=1 Tax=Tenrec ecaudatus TaxID=94439 RepID=UPI003F5A6665